MGFLRRKFTIHAKTAKSPPLLTYAETGEDIEKGSVKLSNISVEKYETERKPDDFLNDVLKNLKDSEKVQPMAIKVNILHLLPHAQLINILFN